MDDKYDEDGVRRVPPEQLEPGLIRDLFCAGFNKHEDFEQELASAQLALARMRPAVLPESEQGRAMVMGWMLRRFGRAMNSGNQC